MRPSGAGEPGPGRRWATTRQRHVQAQTPETSAAYAEVVRRAVEERWQPAPCPPPLAPYPAHDLFAELLRDSAAELADLGVGESDDGVLTPVVRALVELDLDRAGRGSSG